MGHPDIFISTDQELIDMDFIYNSLTKYTFWGKNFSYEELKKSLSHSLLFSVYLASGKQIGFSRVITDYMTLAYITDTFIQENYRHQGIGKLLIKEISIFPELQTVRRWLLVTKDAHTLFKAEGFESLHNPSTYLEKTKLKF